MYVLHSVLILIMCVNNVVYLIFHNWKGSIQLEGGSIGLTEGRNNTVDVNPLGYSIYV